MDKIKKLERSKNRWKYVTPISTVIMFIFFECLIGVSGIGEQIETTILLEILIFVILAIYYYFQNDLAKGAIVDCEQEIRNELIKPDVKKQFHLSTEEQVEVFLNDKTYNPEDFSAEVKITGNGKTLIKQDSYLEKEAVQKFLDARFYAKLISEDEIEVIVKYDEEAEMESPIKISDFVYFRECFKTQP